MTTTCQRAIYSLLDCARHNAVRARQALAEGRPRMHAYYLSVVAECRQDAASLRNTARPA